MFPKVRKVMNAEKLERLGQELEAAKMKKYEKLADFSCLK
jgi:hypothetical protein